MWKAFEAGSHEELVDLCSFASGRTGVWYEDFRIETLTKESEERELVENEHRDLINFIAGRQEMKELIIEWNNLTNLQNQMRVLASKAKKSKDFLYPCQFCRRLWK